ncbi:hypothetical protein [Photobacterium indicum]|uniref:hypothetical protein n=1 Tax=Photobacterium indicum TaxID=81447 RepID=UPI003D13F1B1
MSNPTGRGIHDDRASAPPSSVHNDVQTAIGSASQNEYTHDVTLTINESCDSASYHYLCGTGLKAAT